MTEGQSDMRKRERAERERSLQDYSLDVISSRLRVWKKQINWEMSGEKVVGEKRVK